MSTRTIGFGLIALGVVIALVSLLFDVIGIGNQPGFGWKQQLGTAIGVLMVLAGAWMALRKPNQQK